MPGDLLNALTHLDLPLYIVGERISIIFELPGDREEMNQQDVQCIVAGAHITRMFSSGDPDPATGYVTLTCAPTRVGRGRYDVIGVWRNLNEWFVILHRRGLVGLLRGEFSARANVKMIEESRLRAAA